MWCDSLETKTKVYIIFAIIGAIFVVGASVLDQRNNISRKIIFEKIHSELNIEFVVGYVDSPSVQICIDEYSKFKQKVFELKATTIYIDGDDQYLTSTYYVFNKEMTIAWYYHIRYNMFTTIWFNP